VIHDALGVAVQLQPVWAVTPTDLFPPEAGTLSVVGLRP
jgi:hypothetical protein